MSGSREQYAPTIAWIVLLAGVGLTAIARKTAQSRELERADGVFVNWVDNTSTLISDRRGGIGRCAVLNITMAWCPVNLCLSQERQFDMHPPKAPSDQTVARLRKITAGLTERMSEAENIRARLTKARDANVWPDLQSMSRLFNDIQERAPRT